MAISKGPRVGYGVIGAIVLSISCATWIAVSVVRGMFFPTQVRDPRCDHAPARVMPGPWHALDGAPGPVGLRARVNYLGVPSRSGARWLAAMMINPDGSELGVENLAVPSELVDPAVQQGGAVGVIAFAPALRDDEGRIVVCEVISLP